MFVEVEGKNYEEAVKKACEELKAEEKDLEIEVKEVDTKGILGILGGKKVVIRARLKERPEDFGKRLLKDISRLLGVPFLIKVQKGEGRISFLVQCKDGNFLVGKDGERLLALQYILDLAIAKKFKQRIKILLDINGFREKRKRLITKSARRLAELAKKTGKVQRLGPLNPYERRIVHMTLKNEQGIETRSEGEGHMKDVLILPTNRAE